MTLQQLLAAWGRRADEAIGAGGTAGRTWQVVSGGQRFFLRRRGPRTAGPARIAFDHGLRDHLVAHGFPTVAPLPTITGDRAVATAEGVYELYPWVTGEPYSAALAELARPQVARCLATFHRLAAAFRGACEPLVPQWTHYADPIAPRRRFDDPAGLAAAVEQVAARWARPGDGARLTALRRWLAWWTAAWSDAAHDALPAGVIHGDFNGANLLLQPDGRVAGVFDFDWAWRAPRVRDVGEALLFFGARRDALSGGDIWSLTACPRFEPAPLQQWLAAYHAVAPLTPAELAAVPLALCGRWLACRTEGVMKVPEPQRVRFLTLALDVPLRWCDTAAASLLQAVGG
ncbi:MAG: phosphotransferase [Fimbriimonadaceae bacterium]|nr:phosphotransferase [Fimbriimonadaceae bacterium]